MGTRPQTLYGLADSPVDLAAFMLDHGDGTGQPGLVTQALEGTLQGDLTRDDLLDNITLYWLTNTGISAARLYWENTAGFFDAKPITIPIAISVFPDELYQAPRSWAERAYPTNLIHYHQLDRGGHFAAWEQPQLLTQELRAAFKSCGSRHDGRHETGKPGPRAGSGMDGRGRQRPIDHRDPGRGTGAIPPMGDGNDDQDDTPKPVATAEVGTQCPSLSPTMPSHSSLQC